jgi:hypothetical protein
MYTVNELDEVVVLDNLPRSDAGAPMPFVISDEFTTVVAYLVPDAMLGSLDRSQTA